MTPLQKRILQYVNDHECVGLHTIVRAFSDFTLIGIKRSLTSLENKRFILRAVDTYCGIYYHALSDRERELIIEDDRLR